MSVTDCEHTGATDCMCEPCLELAARRESERQAAIAAYESVSRFLNGRNAGSLVPAIARDHRTLQQAFTGVCVAWLEHLAKLGEGEYDLRNAASVDLAKAVTQTREWAKHSHLPYV
jgi:predicted ATPase